MKKIKFIAILILQVAIIQFGFAQSESYPKDLNGRDKAPSSSQLVDQSKEQPASTKEVYNGISDQDIPGAPRPEVKDYEYPLEIDLLQEEELLNSATQIAIVERINELAEKVNALLQTNEELRLENGVIRESLGNCCSNSKLGLTSKDAYLLQNAPNPYSTSSEIKYFVPAGLDNVQLEIRNVKGELVETIQLNKSGYGKVDIGTTTKINGTYIYSLAINGEMIDSKVMIKAKD